ncbi:uncharacterized protein DUF4238 [Phyllobacterium brassicacearum]|nr:uncharacterized protein DUF4238 [Phyllobacterium brassicacearum]
MSQMDTAAHRGMEAHRTGKPNLSHRNMILRVMKTFLQTESAVQDLDIILLRNRTSRGFVTSDDPAVLTNRLLAQRQGADSTGIASTGVQLTMPLSPRVTLVCFDPSAYLVEAARVIGSTCESLRTFKPSTSFSF